MVCDGDGDGVGCLCCASNLKFIVEFLKRKNNNGSKFEMILPSALLGGQF